VSCCFEAEKDGPMSEKKGRKSSSDVAAPPRKRKIIADLHSGMVLLARFADGEPAAGDGDASGSRRSQEVRKALKTPVPPSRHRWN
jgi:hypothetical protein